MHQQEARSFGQLLGACTRPVRGVAGVSLLVSGVHKVNAPSQKVLGQDSSWMFGAALCPEGPQQMYLQALLRLRLYNNCILRVFV